MLDSRTRIVFYFFSRSETRFRGKMWRLVTHVESKKSSWEMMCSTVCAAIALAIILGGCKMAADSSLARTNDQTVDMSVKVQALQREIRERDKRIEELESQLKALKLIEQDFENQRKPIRPPATLRPIE